MSFGRNGTPLRLTMDHLLLDIRTVLQTTTGGVRVNDLNREYNTVMGHSIPYRQLGFHTLEDYIKNEPRLLLYECNTEVYVEATPDSRSAKFARQTRARSPKPTKPMLHIPLRKPVIAASPRDPVNPSPSVSPLENLPSHPSAHRPQLPTGLPNPRTAPQSVQHLQTVPPLPEKRAPSQRLTILPGRPPNQVSSSVKPEPRRGVREIPTSDKPVLNDRSSRRPNLSITIRQDTLPPSGCKAQSAPVQSNLMKPVDGSNGNGRQVSRQGSLRQGGPGLSARAVRPISDRLKRTPVEPEPPVKEVYSAPLTPPPEQSGTEDDGEDPRDKLRNLAQRLNLQPPEYVTAKTQKRQKTSFYCKVKLGGKHTYTSFPLDASNEIDANKLAASAALDVLQKLPNDFQRLKVTTNEAVIEQRLLAILDAHPTGVFMKKLPDYYQEKHGEELPANWELIVRGCGQLSLDTEIQNVIVCKKGSAVGIPPLVLPQDSLWQVHVSHVASVREVWVRLNEEGSFSRVSEELNRRYSAARSPAALVEVSKHYVMQVDDEYLRVTVESLDTAGNAEVFLIDTGEEGTVETCKLYHLENHFSTSPPQAIRVIPLATEELAICETTTHIAESTLLNKSFYLAALSQEKDDTSHTVVGVFYDTSEEPDVQVNEKIIQIVHETMEAERLDAKLTPGRSLPVCVSSIQYNGDIYLQMKNDGLLILNTMLNCMVEAVEKDKEVMRRGRVSGVLDPEEIFITQRPDKKWVRVQVAFPKNTNSKMRMIDYGGLLEVPTAKLLRLKEFSEVLTRFPVQTVQVQLHNVRTDSIDRIASRLSQLAPTGVPLLCKVVNRDYGRAPSVELFSRTENMLISINNTLEMDDLAGNGDGNNNVKSRKRLESSASTASVDSLKMSSLPKIPEPGMDFEVHIPHSVANPWNFVVQPFEDKWKLEVLMENIQKSYGVDSPAKLSSEAMREGTICAAKMHDGVWYRTCIKQVIDEQIVAVYNCDFGNMNVVNTGQLQVLKKEFMDLPHQAIKAKLFGIKPINGDWTTEACVRFQELVMDKDFVSIVKPSLPDLQLSSDAALELELIDVSTSEKNTRIHQILVKEGHAIPK